MEGQGEEMCLWLPVIVRIPTWFLPPAGSWNMEGDEPSAQDAAFPSLLLPV